jgi:hypothetical protein
MQPQNENPGALAGARGAVAQTLDRADLLAHLNPEIQQAARILARRHCLRLSVARLMVDLGAAGARAAL